MNKNFTLAVACVALLVAVALSCIADGVVIQSTASADHIAVTNLQARMTVEEVATTNEAALRVAGDVAATNAAIQYFVVPGATFTQIVDAAGAFTNIYNAKGLLISHTP
jgi:hypothetical protein